MSTDDTARVARAYYETWTERRGPDALRPLLAEAFVFDAGPIHTFIPPAGTVQTAILPSLFHPGFTAHSDRQVSSSAGRPGAQ